jgi:hypothetical protein
LSVNTLLLEMLEVLIDKMYSHVEVTSL